MHWMELLNNSIGKDSFPTTRACPQNGKYRRKTGERTKLCWKLILQDVVMALTR